MPDSLQISEELLFRVARCFRVDARTIQPVQGGFSGSLIFRIEATDGELFALRVTPLKSSPPEARLEKLADLLGSIYASGVKVVSPPLPVEPSGLRGLPNSGSIHWSRTWLRIANLVYQVEAWKPGASQNGEVSNHQLRNAVSVLHRFHAAAVNAASKLRQNEWFLVDRNVSPGLHRRLQIAQELVDGRYQVMRVQVTHDPDPAFRDLAVRIFGVLDIRLACLLGRLKSLASQTFQLQPVVRDLWRAHVLFTGDEVTGLIDLSAAASDHVCTDLARLLRSWFGADTHRVQEGVTLFSSLRPLSEDERLLFQTLDAASVLLSPVTWLRRRFEAAATAPCPQSVIDRLTELVETAEKFQLL